MRKLVKWGLLLCLLAGLVYAADISEMVIRDGTGGSYYSKIDSDNKLEVSAVTQSALAYASSKGNAYSWSAVTANMNATDTALLVTNTSHSKYLVIEKIYVWTDVPTEITIHCPVAATWAGTAVTGVNLNRTSTNVAEATAYGDETGNTQANIILALQTNETTTDEFGIEYDFKGSVILGYNQSIAADIVAEMAAYNATFIGYYIDM